MNINRVIWILTGANLMFNLCAGFVNPVFAIFLIQSIEGGSATVAGISMAIIWLTKSTFRIPVGYFLDKKKGESDDYYTMVIGFFIFSLAHFLYIFASTPTHIYGIQFLVGLAGAFSFTPWYGFFSRHLDKHHENFEWGIAISLIGFGLSAASFAAGVIVDTYGFTPIFIASGLTGLFGAFLLLSVKKHIKVEMKKTTRYNIKIKPKKKEVRSKK